MTRPVALLALGLIAALLAGCGEDSDDGGIVTSRGSDFEILGSWEGELRQKQLAPFRVTATIGDLDDPAANTVHYTGIDCGGNWTFLGGGTGAADAGEASGDRGDYSFREVIDRGAGGKCKGVGRVTLTPTGPDSVSYVFRGGGVVSRGTLTRQS
jgi:hypothetical protein